MLKIKPRRIVLLLILCFLLHQGGGIPPAGSTESLDAEAYYNRANHAFIQGNYDSAISDYTLAIDKRPGYAKAYFNRGLAYYRTADYDRAISDFTEVIAINPQDAQAYYNRGIVWSKKDDLDQCIADYSEAVKYKPDFTEAYYNRGVILARKGDYERAISDYSQVLEINPDHYSALYNRGLARYSLGDYGGTINDFDQAIEIDRNFGDAYHHYAWILATCPEAKYRNGDKAIELAEIAVNIMQTPATLATLAAAYAEAGHFTAAIEIQEEAILLVEKSERVDLRELIDQFEKRLDSYKQFKPWRQP